MATRQPDLVLISWSRNPLVAGSARRIIAARVIGNAVPCRPSLRPNGLLNTALACLLDNDVGFKVVFRKKLQALADIFCYNVTNRFRGSENCCSLFPVHLIALKVQSILENGVYNLLETESD